MTTQFRQQCLSIMGSRLSLESVDHLGSIMDNNALKVLKLDVFFISEGRRIPEEFVRALKANETLEELLICSSICLKAVGAVNGCLLEEHVLALAPALAPLKTVSLRDGFGLQKAPSIVAAVASITCLDFSDTFFDNGAIKLLAAALEENGTLTSLNVSRSEGVGREGVEALVACGGLNELDISGCGINVVIEAPANLVAKQ